MARQEIKKLKEHFGLEAFSDAALALGAVVFGCPVKGSGLLQPIWEQALCPDFALALKDYYEGGRPPLPDHFPWPLYQVISAQDAFLPAPMLPYNLPIPRALRQAGNETTACLIGDRQIAFGPKKGPAACYLFSMSAPPQPVVLQKEGRPLFDCNYAWKKMFGPLTGSTVMTLEGILSTGKRPQFDDLRVNGEQIIIRGPASAPLAPDTDYWISAVRATNNTTITITIYDIQSRQDVCVGEVTIPLLSRFFVPEETHYTLSVPENSTD